MAKLVVHQPDGTVREVKLDRDRITIGRRPDHDLCLPYPAVSADHAEIITVVADSFLHDLGSTNGTLVNGSRVSKHFLRDRDRIDIGRLQLVYLTNDAETVDPLPPETYGDDVRAVRERLQPAPTPRGDIDPGTRQPAARVAQIAPVDELLTDLMEMQTEATVAVDMPPIVSVVPSAPSHARAERPASPDPNAGAYIEIMSGPNAGQITPMTKREFVFGKAGSTVAVIRRDQLGYRLLPLHGGASPTRNGTPVSADGVRLQFGDTIGVGSVTLRFGRRTPL
jgi:pSer/pThr/pTyr-binding forkhead associated (FHA) protein